jgi:hypothetical protein
VKTIIIEETTWFVTSNAVPISYTTVEYIKDALKAPNVISHLNLVL